MIQTGEIANIIKFDPSNVDFGGKEIGDRFEKGISRFGASFTGGPDLASGVVKLEVTNAGTYESNTSGLSNSTRQLAAGIMNSDTPLKSHLMVAEIDEARSSLIESTSETAFAPEQYWKTPNFNALLQLNPQQATWLHTHETAETEFTAAGIKLTQNLYAGLSLMNHQTEENQTSAFHIFNQNTLLSCFNAPKALGVQISKQLGVFEAGLTYTYAERSGTHTTKLWDIAIHQAFQQQTTAHLGMNFELNQSTQPPISVGIKALFDLYKRIGDHSAEINDNTFKIKGYELSKGLGIQFNTTIPFKCGQLAFAYDAYHASHRLSSNVSLNFQLEN